uniref:hypothetical protein n=1 Tax=Serratia quinivorans TaxID=137545 RepID=UPI0035C66FD5
MDKLRADFEDAWVADNSSTPEEADIRREALKKIWHINENGEGTYFDSFVMWAWKWWQASRASIVVELPEYRSTESYQSAGYNEALDDCDSAIRSIGLSIKGE